jgi:hypothetical protein
MLHDRSRNADAAGIGHLLQLRRNIHRISIPIHYHVAEID